MLVQARELGWLAAHDLGSTLRQIAQAEGLSTRSISLGLKRAKLLEQRYASGRHEAPREPRLVPLFPVEPFTPGSSCGHAGPLPTGSLLCCMVCSRSGVDDHPALQRDPATDPRPELKSKASTPAKLTRKLRRARAKGAT